MKYKLVAERHKQGRAWGVRESGGKGEDHPNETGMKINTEAYYLTIQLCKGRWKHGKGI